MMPIDYLTQRVSCPLLKMPAPTEQQLALLFKAASRAADHAMLKPYRFLIVTEQENLIALGQQFRDAAYALDKSLDEQQLQRIEELPTRAPMVIIAITCYQEHPKVPQSEQQITAGAAVQNLLNAAFMLDIGAYWRTGDLSYNPELKKRLSLTKNETIFGFVYLGQPAAPYRILKDKETTANISYWPTNDLKS
jgi:nitroreductase